MKGPRFQVLAVAVAGMLSAGAMDMFSVAEATVGDVVPADSVAMGDATPVRGAEAGGRHDGVSGAAVHEVADRSNSWEWTPDLSVERLDAARSGQSIAVWGDGSVVNSRARSQTAVAVLATGNFEECATDSCSGSPEFEAKRRPSSGWSKPHAAPAPSGVSQALRLGARVFQAVQSDVTL